MLTTMHILVMKGLTLPAVSDEDRGRIRAAAGAGATITVVDGATDALELAADVEVMLGSITSEFFERAPRLRWVHAIASGADAYLFPALRDSEVILTGEKGLVGGHLADHAFALLLSITRRLAEAVRLGPDSWGQRSRFRAEAVELEGLTMGIVGFGGTGRAIARRAAAFGMRCEAVDLLEVPGSAEVPKVGGMDEFDALLARADVVAVALPLTPATVGLFDARVFALMKRSAILINVTRGGIVDGEALVAALRGGEIAGAGLDVAPEEPLHPDHPLWAMPNVVMTPHTAGASQLRAGRNVARFCENLERFRRGQPLLGQIDKQAGF